MVDNNTYDEELTETDNFKAFLKEEKPEYRRGDEINLNGEYVRIRSIYSRRLEDLTFGDLGMIGYTNPNLFVREWSKEHESFDKDMVVWIVVYVGDVE